jgi:hypothetical protein
MGRSDRRRRPSNRDEPYRHPSRVRNESVIITRLEGIIDQRQLEILQAKKELEAVKKELREAHDKIWQLQPRREDVPEEAAANSYVSLVTSVQYWVDSAMLSLLDDFDKGNFESLRRPPWLAVAHEQHSLFQARAGDHLYVPGSESFHVIAIIMEFLKRHIFCAPFYCPLKGVTPGAEDPIEFIVHIWEMMQTDRRMYRCTCNLASTPIPEYADPCLPVFASLTGNQISVSPATGGLSASVPSSSRLASGPPGRAWPNATLASSPSYSSPS